MSEYPVYLESPQEDTLGGCVFPIVAGFALFFLMTLVLFYIKG